MADDFVVKLVGFLFGTLAFLGANLIMKAMRTQLWKNLRSFLLRKKQYIPLMGESLSSKATLLNLPNYYYVYASDAEGCSCELDMARKSIFSFFFFSEELVVTEMVVELLSEKKELFGESLFQNMRMIVASGFLVVLSYRVSSLWGIFF